jgi:phosphohistidine phosphatase
MKTLFLIRHAKSSWDDTALPDKDRPLANRGRRDAPKMGRRLAKREVKPDLILSSPARRALTTAEIIAKKLDYKLKNIVVDDRLYAGAVHGLLDVIHKRRCEFREYIICALITPQNNWPQGLHIDISFGAARRNSRGI